VGVIGYFVFPVLLEVGINLYSTLFFKQVQYLKELQKKESKMNKLKYPIVYHPGYNLKCFGFEKLHPFDSQKYAKLYDLLLKKKVIIDESNIHKPSNISRALLATGHSRTYLFRLCYSIILTRIVEIPICILPAAIIRWRLLEPMGLATQGTIDAGLLALLKGWAINLSGGYHNASFHDGGGFCVYADISMCINHLKRYHGEKVKKVMIIDLDAHQGNGHERDFMQDPDVLIIDAYNPNIFPYDFPARKAITVDIPVYATDNDERYLSKLETHIPPVVESFLPDFILYNAGTDILDGDPLGGLHISDKGIIKRDELIFEVAFKHKIPVLMVLSGGYQSTNAEVIADSVDNIVKKFNLL